MTGSVRRISASSGINDDASSMSSRFQEISETSSEQSDNSQVPLSTVFSHLSVIEDNVYLTKLVEKITKLDSEKRTWKQKLEVVA